MHGDPPAKIREKIADVSARRERRGLPQMKFGVAGYVVLRDTEKEARAELARITRVKQSAEGSRNYQHVSAGTLVKQSVALEEDADIDRGRPSRPGVAGEEVPAR